jgi:hypothetical protein
LKNNLTLFEAEELGVASNRVRLGERVDSIKKAVRFTQGCLPNKASSIGGAKLSNSSLFKQLVVKNSTPVGNS